jgi:hypothetical protein
VTLLSIRPLACESGAGCRILLVAAAVAARALQRVDGDAVDTRDDDLDPRPPPPLVAGGPVVIAMDGETVRGT